MNMMNRKSLKPSLPEDPAYYDERIKALRAIDAQELKLQIELEAVRKPVREGQDTPPIDIEDHAMQLLSGCEFKIPANHPLRLELVRAKRTAIARAIELGSSRQFLIFMSHAENERVRRAGEWRDLIRNTALAICRLQKLSRDRLALASQIRGKASTFALPCEFPLNPGILLGLGHQGGGSAHEFLRVAIQEGFITAGEIARERGDSERAIKDAFGV
jgi:hypothetical protein